MSLDGLRAWIGEVERKLGMRTRVFLVLAVIAIGGAGAGIYLAIDARESSVSESDVQALQGQLEARIGEGGGGGTALTQLETELAELQAEVDRLSGKGSSAEKGKGGGETSSGGGSEEAPGGGSDEASQGTSGIASEEAGKASTDEAGDARGNLGELLEQAKEQNAQAEKEKTDER